MALELVAVMIKHINYVPAVIPKIFDRMRSERIRIANKYESEGRRDEAEILGYMKKELEKIESEGYKVATETRGDADAEAIKDICGRLQERSGILYFYKDP